MDPSKPKLPGLTLTILQESVADRPIYTHAIRLYQMTEDQAIDALKSAIDAVRQSKETKPLQQD